MEFIYKNNNVKLWLLILVITFFYGLIFTFSEFYKSPYDGLKDFCILGMQWIVVVIATTGLLYTLVLNKYIFSIIFPLLTLVCTILTYFRYTAKIALTPMIIDLALINDTRTCLDVFSVQLVIWLLLSLCFSGFIVYYRWKYIRIDKWYWHLLVSMILVMLTNVWITRFIRPVSERMPYSVFYNVKRYIEEKRIMSENRDTFVKGVVKCNSDSTIVVLVLGESLRSDHLHFNGYNRNTTPFLSKDTAVISYPFIYTEPFYTHTSVPHILTRADSIYPNRAYNEQSFITLLNRVGYNTSWIANQESVDTYAYFMNECDTLIYANRGQSLYKFDKWLDEDLLPYYKKELQKQNSKKFILLHTIGSHWWYNARFSDAFIKYKPIIKSRVVSSCTKEEMINSYDNTVLYTDYILSKFIDELRTKKAILFYLSDHGEALGENGFYLHADDYPILHHPACFVWYSSAFARAHSYKIQNLKNNRLKKYRTDFMFHTILDASEVESEYLNKKFSILSD